MMIHSQFVRDLSWVVSSPSLIVDGAADAQHLDVAAVDPDDLALFMSSRSSRRVGFYFESLIHYWLTRVRAVDLVEHGFQVRKENRTVGELDFLFRDEQGIFTHWETAVKFYLHFPGTNESHFIGPHAVDNFERKMQRLFERQLPRSKEYFPQVTRRGALVKGRIFYHPQQAVPVSLPQRLSPTHLRGTWIRESELSWLDEQDRGDGYCLIDKPFWLSPMIGDDHSWRPIDRNELKANLKERFSREPKPVLVSRVERSGDHTREVDRLFIVSRTWPAS